MNYHFYIVYIYWFAYRLVGLFELIYIITDFYIVRSPENEYFTAKNLISKNQPFVLFSGHYHQLSQLWLLRPANSSPPHHQRGKRRR